MHLPHPPLKKKTVLGKILNNPIPYSENFRITNYGSTQRPWNEQDFVECNVLFCGSSQWHYWLICKLSHYNDHRFSIKCPHLPIQSSRSDQCNVFFLVCVFFNCYNIRHEWIKNVCPSHAHVKEPTSQTLQRLSPGSSQSKTMFLLRVKYSFFIPFFFLPYFKHFSQFTFKIFFFFFKLV